jgi:glycosyltransferase involved in cell wall biosynthesis
MPFNRNPLSRDNFVGLGARIRAVVTEGQYNIVHVHTPVAAFVTRLAMRKIPSESRPKVVYTAHGFHFYNGGAPLKNMAFAALERLAGDWTDRIVTLNKEDYEAALEHKISDEKRLCVMPGIGIDLEQYSPQRVDISEVKKFHKSLALDKNDELFLMAAEFISRKRHKDAIRALAETGRMNFHLALAGAGPLEEPMKQLASKLGVARRVHFLGERDDVPLLMLSSRATVLPSRQEGFSRSVMESICLGIPVLGADVRGIRDIVDRPDRGMLFPVGNHAALAAAMILTTDDRATVKPKPDPRWNIKNLLKEHEALYQGLF